MAGKKMYLEITSLLMLLIICGTNSQNILTKLEQGVQEILNHLKEQDRQQEKIQETMQILNLDSTLKKIAEQVADIARQLRTASGRSGVATGEVQNLEIRIDSMENNVVSNVKGGLKKIEDMKKNTEEIKYEMESRLGKIMNLVSAVYKEINGINKLTTSNSSKTEDSESKALFESEQMEALEKKVTESLSITTRTLTSEIQNIKSQVLEPFLACRDLAEQVEDMKGKCESISIPDMTQSETDGGGHWQSKPSQEHMIKDITETIMKNLTRVEREISEKLDKKLQEIESKISAPQPIKEQTEEKAKETVEHNTEKMNSPITTPSSDYQIAPIIRTPEERKEDPKDCKSLNYEVPRPHSCYELKQAGVSCNGAYIIFPKGMKAVYAYCDMNKEGGGWTVIMRRGNHGRSHVNFDQNWQGYKVGFGDINGEFWLGNENIRMLTSGQETMTLQISLEAFDGNRVDITYDEFWIESEENQYRLHLGNATRSQVYLASSLQHHNGRPFTTHDRNNEDKGNQNCALRYRGGWWYNRCHYALLTAPLFDKNQFRQKWQGMQWHAWKGNEALKGAEMKIRPKTPY